MVLQPATSPAIPPAETETIFNLIWTVPPFAKAALYMKIQGKWV